MKKLCVVLLMSTMFAVPRCHAEDVTTGSSSQSTSADDTFSRLWKDLSNNSSLHLLDNLTPATFYDFKKHELMAGGTTELYNYRHLSADFGVVRSIESGDNAIPIAGIKLKIGEYLDQFEAMHNLGNKLGLDQGLLKMLTAGGWGARDFDQGIWRYGVYGGILILFK